MLRNQYTYKVYGVKYVLHASVEIQTLLLNDIVFKKGSDNVLSNSL